MRFEIRDANKRLKLDANYLDVMKQRGLTCPKCKSGTGLKLRTKMDCHVFIYCDYKLECKNCGYEQENWFDSTADAVESMKQENIKNMNHE